MEYIDGEFKEYFYDQANQDLKLLYNVLVLLILKNFGHKY